MVPWGAGHLRHLPLMREFIRVELDLNKLLSVETKKHFKHEFDRRKQQRKKRVRHPFSLPSLPFLVVSFHSCRFILVRFFVVQVAVAVVHLY